MGIEPFCYWFCDKINVPYSKNISETCQENAEFSLAEATIVITVV